MKFMQQEVLTMNEIKRFVADIDSNYSESIKYCAGQVEINGNITQSQLGAIRTFSIGMPVFSTDNKFLGYLGLRLWESLDYAIESNRTNRHKIPVEHWVIEGYRGNRMPIKTYWQVYGDVANE